MLLRFPLFVVCSWMIFLSAGFTQPPTIEKMEQARLHFSNGVQMGIDKKFQNAVDEFNKAIELNPLYAEAFLYKGLAKIEMGEYEQAIRDFTITIELDPAFSDQAHYFRGLARYHRNELTESIDDLTIAIRMNPDFVAFYQRGKANLKLREYRRSINDFEIALRLNPGFYEAYLYRGINLYFLREYEYAIEDLEIAKKNLPNNPDAFYYSGLARTAIQNSYVAIEDLNRAIELDPSYAPAYEARAAARDITGNSRLAHQDRAQAQQQQQLAQQTVTASRPASANTPQHNVSAPEPEPEAAPRTSTEINFQELFSASRNTPDQQGASQSDAAQIQTTQIHVVAGQSPVVAPVVLQQLPSGTYGRDMSPVRPEGFGVQVASYTNTDNLVSLAQAYREKYGQPVFVNISNSNGRTLYKLVIGTFQARAQAESFRDELRKTDFPDSFLIVFNNL